MELAFAGLHQLCAPLLDRLDRLPRPQRDALATAFGLSAGTAAGPLPGRPGGAEPAGRGRRGAAADLPGRRRPVARPASRRRRSLSSLGGCWPNGWRSYSRFARPATPTSSRGLPELVVTGLGDDDARALLDLGDHRARRRARPRPDRRRDARQPARAARAAARADGRPSWPAGSGCPTRVPLASQIEESFLRRARTAARRDAAAAADRRRRTGRRCRPCCGARPSGSGIGPDAAAAGRGGGPDRVRRPGAVPASAGALGRVPGGVRRRPARACTARWPTPPTASARPRPPGLAPGPRRPRGPTKRSPPSWSDSADRAQAPRRRWRPRRRSSSGRRADPRPGAPGASARWPPRRPSRAGAPDAALGLLAAAEAGPLDELAARPASTCCAPRSRSPAAAAATRRRCCSRRPGGSSRSTSALARDTYLDALVGGAVRRPARRRRRRCRRSRGPPAPRRRQPSPPRADRPPARRAGDAVHRGLRGRGADAEAGAERLRRRAIARRTGSAGSGSPATPPRAVGRRDAGTCSPPATSSSPARPGALGVSRSRSIARAVMHLFAGELDRGRDAGRGGRRRRPRRPGARPRAVRRARARRAPGRRARGVAADRGPPRARLRPRRGHGA